MTPTRAAVAAALTLALGACSRGQAVAPTQTAAVAPLSPTGTATPAAAATLQPGAANGYSCTFQGTGRQSILARFTLDGATARDDQGLAFAVLANSPTALVLAHARDEVTGTPGGDIGAYVVAIDRRTLDMVQSSVGLSGQGSTRRGHCIAG